MDGMKVVPKTKFTLISPWMRIVGRAKWGITGPSKVVDLAMALLTTSPWDMALEFWRMAQLSSGEQLKEDIGRGRFPCRQVGRHHLLAVVLALALKRRSFIGKGS
jgi:hypothetical protein